MRLHRIHLNPRCKEARRDLADPYQMHATLCRAFFPSDKPCPPGALLWRLEPETDGRGFPRMLVQSREVPDWGCLPNDWLAPERSDVGAAIGPGVDLVHKLALDRLQVGQEFRFRLRANPSKTVAGKRVGLLRFEAQQEWLLRKGEQHGFVLPKIASTGAFDYFDGAVGTPDHHVRSSQDRMLTGRRHDGHIIRVFSVLFDGRLQVRDPDKFLVAVERGIGHGKVMGLGMLSIARS